MTNAERAAEIDQAIKLLEGAASAYRHGRGATAQAKFNEALDKLDLLEHNG